MKRERPRCDGDEASVSKTWPIFIWKLCVVCKKEFRREWGWEHTTYGYNNAISRCVCFECCPTEQDTLDSVEKYVQDYKERMKRLQANPPTDGSSVSSPPIPCDGISFSKGS